MIRSIKDEGGYSLVEVMVAIMILAIAIIPMVGMFDTGLKTATAGSNYDKARALANANLEKVMSLPHSTATATYKPVNDTSSPAGTAVSCDQAPFTCTVATSYVDWRPDLTPPRYEPLPNSANPSSKNEVRITVTVTWESGSKSYTTTGFKAL